MKPRKLFLVPFAILFCVILAAAQNANAPTPTAEKKHAPKAANAPETKEINDRLAKLTDSVTELKSRVDKLAESQTNAELKAKVDALSGRLSNEFWITMCIAALLVIVLAYAVGKFLPAVRNVAHCATTQSVTDLQGAFEQSITQTGTAVRESLAQLAQGVADARAEQRLALAQLAQSVADARVALAQSINESRLAQQQALAQLAQSVADARGALAQSVNEARIAQQQALEQLAHSAGH